MKLRTFVLAALALPLAHLSAHPAAPQVGVAPLNVTQFGAFPDDGVDDTAAIQSALNALANGQTLIFDAPGVYELSRPPATWPGAPGVTTPTPLLSINGKHGITITAVPRVTLELTGYDRSVATPGIRYPNLLEVRNCNGLTLAGAGPNDPLVFDTRGAAQPTPGNDGLPFIQGRVKSINTAARLVQLLVEDPEMFLPTTCSPYIWGAWQVVDGQPGVNADWSRGSVLATSAPVSGSQLVELSFTVLGWAQPHANWTIGSDVVVLLNDSDTYALSIHRCGAVVLRDLVAHHLPGKFVQATSMEALEVQNVDVRPLYDGRLLSVNRDGINASAKYLVVRDCDLVGCGDDGIVAHGSSYGVVTAYNTNLNTFQLEPATSLNSWPPEARVGEHIVLLDQSSMDALPFELAQISAIQYTQPTPSSPAKLDYTYVNETPGFEARLSTGACYAYNPWWSLFGSRVENCTVASDRGVGITTRGINTTITSCTVTKASVLGIHAGGGMVAAYPWGGQGSPPHNLRIEYCYIDSCGGLQPYSDLTGSIEIAVASSSTASSGSCTYYINAVHPTSPQAILDVTLEGNVIRGSRRAGVFASNVGGGTGMQITNNWFLDCGAPNACHPEYDTAIVLNNCGNGLISGNLFYNCANKTNITNSPNVVVIP